MYAMCIPNLKFVAVVIRETDEISKFKSRSCDLDYDPFDLVFACRQITPHSRCKHQIYNRFSPSGDIRNANIKNLGAVRHLGFDRKYILTIPRLPWNHLVSVREFLA